MLYSTCAPCSADAAGRAARAAAFALAAAFAPLAAIAELPARMDVERFEVGRDVYVRALALDGPRNAVWVGTSVGALEIGLDSREPRRVLTRKDGLANEYVFAIGVAPSGDVWFGTNAGGTSRLTEAGWETYFPMHGLADYWVYAFDYDERERVWIGTWDGANLFDPATGEWITYHDELINIWVYGIDIDDKGRIWFGTEGGVNMFDGADWLAWTHDEGLGAANERGLPPSPNTGLGTRARHDLSVYVGDRATYNPNYVFSVKVDDTGRGVWFGTWGAGASLFDMDKTWTNYTSADGLAGDVVYSIAQGADGVMWFGTNHGVSAYDGATWRAYPSGRHNEHIYALAIDPEGAVWAGTNGAVLRLTPAE